MCWTNKLPASLGKQSNLQMEAYNSFEKEMSSAKPLMNIITSQTKRGVKYLYFKMRILFLCGLQVPLLRSIIPPEQNSIRRTEGQTFIKYMQTIPRLWTCTGLDV